jgi:hypothetical protein
MSESGDKSKLMRDIFKDTESGEDSEEYTLNNKAKTQKVLSNYSEEIISVYDALFEYYKLKEKFEKELNTNKRRIINNSTLSKRDKRLEYLKFMPKCVNCKRRNRKGMIFSITYHEADDKNGEYRVFKASCGDLANPCNLNIEVNVGGKQALDEELNNITNEITQAKHNIINDKNKLLFGLITTDKAIENFDYNKTYISDITYIYEKYLDIWNKEVDNPEKKVELDEALIQSYNAIYQIKDCIKKMNENNDKQFAIDAATIYHTTLQPLLNKIRHLKYSENMVFYDDNTCKLIQRKYKIDDILISGYSSKVIAYDVGFTAMNVKKPQIQLSEEKEFSIKISKQDESLPIQIGKLEDEPIIGQGLDGIEWHTEEYKKLWSLLPLALRTEFKSNIDWMKEFMYKCVNEQKSHGAQWNGCRLTTPPNIVIPPRQLENGQYDFGVSIYNKVFNKLPQTTRTTYLTLYKEDPQTKVKDYSMLEEALNRQVESEVGFGRGFF